VKRDFTTVKIGTPTRPPRLTTAQPFPSETRRLSTSDSVDTSGLLALIDIVRKAAGLPPAN